MKVSRRGLVQPLCRLVCAMVLFHPPGAFGQRLSGNGPGSGTVIVSISPGHPANRFIPSHALGAAIDGTDEGTTNEQLTPGNIKEMLSAGLKSLTYRLRTELGIAVWHWNPRGTWSDAGHQQGYWISDSKSEAPISLSYGYQLPRRGATIDNANNDGFSRLDDGDSETFWKSNPYLDRYFTQESNSLHQQWIVIEFSKAKSLNAVRLFWGEPFAKSYRIQYSNLDDIADIAFSPPGMWHDFPRGLVRNGAGGEVFRQLATVPVKARCVRILLTESSGGSGPGPTDVRDRIGFAMREIHLGSVDQQGKFRDEIQRGTDRHTQTLMHVSSTDPWHRETDLDEGAEQPGLDRVYQSGLTNNLPMLLPAGVFYDTPENAANEIRYLRARGYSFDRVELGEEPDGQYATPEDFGALYLQFAAAIHAVDPTLKLGGPSFQEIQPDTRGRKVRLGNSAWLGRFLRYLSARGRTTDYAFFSFEWYPFDNTCVPVAPQLARASKMLIHALREMERRGLSHRLPWIISEYGYSAFGARAELTIEGALLNADIVGNFLTLGGDQAFLYGYTPSQVLADSRCAPGNNMMFSLDDQGDIEHRFATYFGAQLLTREWTKPADEWHEIYPASSTVTNSKGEAIVTAYAVHRPDGLWALLLINKDPNRAYQMQVNFRNAENGKVSAFAGPVDLYQFSGVQYQLNADQQDPHPIKSDPPAHTVVESDQTKSFALPAYSLTVVRGSGPTLARQRSKRR